MARAPSSSVRSLLRRLSSPSVSAANVRRTPKPSPPYDAASSTEILPLRYAELVSSSVPLLHSRRQIVRFQLGRDFVRRFSSSVKEEDEVALEEEAEKKVGWLLKSIFIATAGFAAYEFFPYMDERRMKVVEMGGAKELLNVLKAATDDKTRKETLKALVALSKSDEAAGFLHQAGAVSVVSSISNSSEFAEVEAHKTSLLEKFEKLKS